MSWLKELSFVDTTGAKKNHSFWKVSDPSDFLVGANAAFELLNFYQRYPEMKHSPLLYRITNDMNRSGLLSSESAKGFFREGANKQVISSQADSLIKISRIWADFFPANTSNQPI